MPYRIVNCYHSDIISQLSDCSALMWHFSHADERDFLFARQLIAAVEAMGKLTFPNVRSCWHFDDKISQKYLLEGIDAPFAHSYVFYTHHEAREWATSTIFPKVFKLRSGAGSANVRLIENKNQAQKIIKQAFSRGFRQFDRIALLRDGLHHFIAKKINVVTLLKTMGKVFVHSQYERYKGREIGYVFFQDFYPGNTYDIRVVIIGYKAFAIKRLVRKDDFRASGSGKLIHDATQIDIRCVQLAFHMSEKIGANCLAYDFIFDADNNPVVLEISFGFSQAGYDDCQGFWDRKLDWHPGKYRQQDWMVEYVIANAGDKGLAGNTRS